ncbi:MAG: carbon storage regulator CsrA [Sedimentisphaerales bacterium]
MLVLSRQRDESIMIGDDVKITIVDVRGDKVRLGIEAPKEIPVHRMEIYEAIQREKKEKQAQEQPEKQPEKTAQKEPGKEPGKQLQQPEKAAQEEPAKAPQKQHK